MSDALCYMDRAQIDRAMDSAVRRAWPRYITWVCAPARGAHQPPRVCMQLDSGFGGVEASAVFPEGASIDVVARAILDCAHRLWMEAREHVRSSRHEPAYVFTPDSYELDPSWYTARYSNPYREHQAALQAELSRVELMPEPRFTAAPVARPKAPKRELHEDEGG